MQGSLRYKEPYQRRNSLQPWNDGCSLICKEDIKDGQILHVRFGMAYNMSLRSSSNMISASELDQLRAASMHGRRAAAQVVCGCRTFSSTAKNHCAFHSACSRTARLFANGGSEKSASGDKAPCTEKKVAGGRRCRIKW